MPDKGEAERSAVELLRQQVQDGFADYDFRPAAEVFGADGAAVVAWWANAIAERSLIHPDHYRDVADGVQVEFATTPVSTMHLSFNGREG